MTKQLFTPAGVQAKVAELYALPETNLQKEAGLIRTDFRSWLSANFSLSAKQSVYLSAMDIRFLEYAGQLTSSSVSARLDISLIAPNPPDIWSSKYIKPGKAPSPQYDSGGGYSITGSLEFTIGYTK
jgi:hypothetical protein